MAKQKKENSFEEKIHRIEDIIHTINNDKVPLQEAIALHSEASILIKESEEYLQNAALQFETLQ